MRRKVFLWEKHFSELLFLAGILFCWKNLAAYAVAVRLLVRLFIP